jgi:hypothetical protein
MKFFSFNRNYVAAIITLIFVIFCGGIYSFIYVPNNEKNLQEQRFRTLQNIDENLHKKIDNSVALMSNLLTAYVRDDASREYVKKYINNYSTENFTLTLPIIKGSKKILQNKFSDSSYNITVNDDNRLITLQLIKRSIDSTDTTSYRMSMMMSFNQFIKFLFPENVFDQYLVFSNGQLVYETFPSGINYLKDSLLDKKNGIEVSSVRSLNISGKDYKLFSQSINFTFDKEWVITGLLSKSRYQAEKNQLPTNGVLLLVTIVFIIILAFPWIKLYQMGSKDRLTVTDGISTIAVSMLLMSILFFTFFKYNLVLRPDKSLNSNDTLAAQITTAFQNEVDTVYKKLKVSDHYVNENPVFFSDIINFNTDSISFKNSGIDADPKSLLNVARDLNINQVFWLDKNGNEQANWIAANMNSPHGNFKNRNYFKKIVSGNEYLLDKDSSQKYYLDQIVSWTSGSFTSVLSMPSSVEGQAIGAVSFNFKSLNNPTLPEGYQFAIIDTNGTVLYNSDEARNLNENLLREFSESEKLSGNIEARTAGSFETKYFSKEYDASIRPIDNLPYFIVLLDDAGYRETRDTEIYSFTFSMMLLFFGFLVLELFIVFLVSSKRSFFKMQLYDTSWIGPKISSHHQYNIATLFNAVIIVWVLAFFSISTFLTYLYILLFSVTFIGIFLTTLFALRYKNNNQVDNYKFKIKTIRSLLISIIIIDVAAWRMLEGNDFMLLLVYELLTFVAGWIFFKYGDNILTAIRKRSGKKILSNWNYKRSFALMGLTRLIITSGIPVIFFYITSYNFEQNISIRYRQLQYANQLKSKLPGNSFENINNNNDFARGYYYDGAWINKIDFTKNDSPTTYSREEIITTKMLELFRINISGAAVKEEKFYTTGATDSSFFYNPLFKDAGKTDNVSTTYVQTHTPGKYLAISSARLNYKVPSPFNKGWFGASLFWILLFFALVVFCIMIYTIISKLFCLGLPDLTEWSPLDDKLITTFHLNKLLFIIGLPGSGKLSIIKEKIKNGEIQSESATLIYNENDDGASNVFIADLINIPDSGDNRESDPEWKEYKAKTFAEKNKLIIVNHFEYNIQDAATNRVKLNFLESLMLDSKCKIIILSTVHPVSFLDSIMEQSINTTDKSAPGRDLERWHVLLGHYRIIVLPLQQSGADNMDNTFESIYKETQQTHFLIKVQPYAIDVAKDLREKHVKVDADELAFKLQITSHYFYMYIWQSLTKEEKFLLYDLAEDNLVNSYNDYDLNMLLAKGIITRPDGTLKLFNKGFRNFILTAIGNSEAMKIKNNIKDSGNWNKLKNPLIILVLAILAFLLTSQQEVYSKLISYVAALIAGMPVVLKLFSFFSKSDQKSS